MKSIASFNGLKATRKAFELLEQGSAAVDATVAGVTLVEDDPDEMTVGFGGFPNENGFVELDAAVMDGPTHRCGAVAGLRGVRHAAQVARLVMQQTGRVLLVGEGALEFARANGFSEENLLTDRAREMWLHWKRIRSGMDDWTEPDSTRVKPDVAEFFRKFTRTLGGTVHCSAIDQQGNLGCTTSTSGHPFKMMGRVGDSPIPGAGLYCDNRFGSCGSIGHGEANLENLSSFQAVELLRQGATASEAGLEVLRRVADHLHPDQYDKDGRPNIHLQLFVMSRDGDHAGVTMRGQHQVAVSDANGTRLEDSTSFITD